MDQTKPVFRLEQVLRTWEDQCFFKRITAQAAVSQGKPPPYPIAGPLLNAQSFRSYVLRDDSDQFDVDRYFFPVETAQALGVWCLVPGTLWAWAKSSRRFFHLAEDLQALLNATSLERMRWSDVDLPFQAFAVTLERPIEDAKGNAYDCILVCADRGPGPDGVEADVLSFQLIANSFAERKPLSFFDRQQIERALGARDWKKLDHRLKTARASTKGGFTSRFLLMMDKVGDEMVTESVSRLIQKTHSTICNCGGTHEEWDAAVRAVVGMCLYLQSLKPKDKHRPTWQPAPKGQPAKMGQPRAVTSEAEVCTVTCANTLSAEERAAFLEHGNRPRASGEKRPHFRMGHWRRKPNTASDPNAEKVVHVMPTLVRRDLLKKGELVSGSETTVAAK
jgi:hypothetical protein